MGELEKYGLLSASLLLLMAGLLAFFGRDSDVDMGAHALSANNDVVERNTDPGTRTRDSVAPRDVPKQTNPSQQPADPPRSPIDNEHENGGDDTEPREGGKHESEPQDDHPTEPEKPVESDAPVHYAVKSGDTLSSIAAAHFGDKKYYKLIEQANPGVDSRSLKIGQELILPAKRATKAQATPSKSPAGEASPKLKMGKATPAKGLEAAKDAKAAGAGKSAPAVAADRSTSPKSDAPAKADNSPRKASKDTQKPADSGAKKGPREHRVAKGDTLTSIARKYYNDANKWKTIFDANRDKLKSTSIVPEGVLLKIP